MSLKQKIYVLKQHLLVVGLTDILTYKASNFNNSLREADRGFFLPDSFSLSENASNECSFIKIGDEADYLHNYLK